MDQSVLFDVFVRNGFTVVCAVEALAKLVVGKSLQEIVGDFCGFYRLLTSESQLRWVRMSMHVLHFYCNKHTSNHQASSMWLYLLPVRSREGSDPPGQCCSPECCVGPLGESRGQGGTDVMKQFQPTRSKLRMCFLFFFFFVAAVEAARWHG